MPTPPKEIKRYITHVYEIVDEEEYGKQVNPFGKKEKGMICVGMELGDLMEWKQKALDMFQHLENL